MKKLLVLNTPGHNDIKKEGISRCPLFLKLQRSNYTLMREHERNWKIFSNRAENGSLPIVCYHKNNFLHYPTEFVKKNCSREGCSLMAKNAKRRIVGWIFRAWVTRKDGTRDWARDHGYKAWRIPVYAD